MLLSTLRAYCFWCAFYAHDYTDELFEWFIVFDWNEMNRKRDTDGLYVHAIAYNCPPAPHISIKIQMIISLPLFLIPAPSVRVRQFNMLLKSLAMCYKWIKRYCVTDWRNFRCLKLVALKRIDKREMSHILKKITNYGNIEMASVCWMRKTMKNLLNSQRLKHIFHSICMPSFLHITHTIVDLNKIIQSVSHRCDNADNTCAAPFVFLGTQNSNDKWVIVR